MRARSLFVALGASAALPILLAAPAEAGPSSPPPFVFPDGCCYYNDSIVRTVVPPASTPQEGTDNFYGVPGQKGVVAVVPGTPSYHGGHWKFFSVSWNVDPYLLTSEGDVLAAAAAGDVTVTREPQMDFKCPIQP